MDILNACFTIKLVFLQSYVCETFYIDLIIVFAAICCCEKMKYLIILIYPSSLYECRMFMFIMMARFAILTNNNSGSKHTVSF
jgi:hypothetical protein